MKRQFQESKEQEENIEIDDSLLLDLLGHDNFLIENENTWINDHNNIANCNNIIQVPHPHDVMILHTNDVLIDLSTPAKSFDVNTSFGADNNHIINWKQNIFTYHYINCDVDVSPGEEIEQEMKMKIHNLPLKFDRFLLYRNNCINKYDLIELKYIISHYYDPECIILSKFRIGVKGIVKKSNVSLYQNWEMIYEVAPDFIISAFDVTERFIKGDHKFIRWTYTERATVVDIAPYESFYEELKKEDIKDRNYMSFKKLQSRLYPNNVIEVCASGINSVVVNMKTNKIVKSSTLQNHMRFRIKTL